MNPEEDPDCAKALDNLHRFIDHELDDASWSEIQAHIDACEPCLGEFDLEYLVKQVVARSCSERAPEPLRERVRMSIRAVRVQVTEEPR